MPRKKLKPEEIVAKLRQIDVIMAQGAPLAKAIGAIGVRQVPHNRWHNEFGGLKHDQVKRLKELERENLRLWRAASNPTFDKMILSEALRGN